MIIRFDNTIQDFTRKNILDLTPHSEYESSKNLFIFIEKILMGWVQLQVTTN